MQAQLGNINFVGPHIPEFCSGDSCEGGAGVSEPSLLNKANTNDKEYKEGEEEL